MLPRRHESMKESRGITCRGERRSWFRRVLALLGFWHGSRRCGDVPFDEPLDIAVRELRRPRPSAPGGAIALEAPQPELGWNA
jgi:hypothetical protein